MSILTLYHYEIEPGVAATPSGYLAGLSAQYPELRALFEELEARREEAANRELHWVAKDDHDEICDDLENERDDALSALEEREQDLLYADAKIDALQDEIGELQAKLDSLLQP